MNNQGKNKEELREELQELQDDFLNSIKGIDTNKRRQLNEELENALHNISLENLEKAKRASQLILANLEIKFLSEEKEKCAADLVAANIELVYQNNEKSKRAAELSIANKELLFQNEEKEKRATELMRANQELLFQNREKEKRAIELIQAKQVAEDSEQLKSAFLAHMSHEIRTPMNGILGFCDLLKEPQLTGEKQQEYIEIIKKSGLRMLNIINDIISMAKIESGLLEAHLQEVNINYKIDFIYNFFKHEAELKGLGFTTKKPLADKDATINSDVEKIYSILGNLVKNAIKHTATGNIEMGYVIKTDQQTSLVEFYVKDSGFGIPQNKHLSIFERFRQIKVSNNMDLQGAGLGLPISKAYVELLGGKIWIASEKGKGSIFYFTLPYRTEQRDKTGGQNNNSFKRKQQSATIEDLKLKTLIVEDDEVSRLLITTYVKKVSDTILVAKTGQDAVHVLKNHPDIDLVLMDIQLPVMDGFEATRQIRQFNEEVIIIAQTASGLSEDKEKTMGVGCNEYMLKPIKRSTLLALVQKYFSA